MGLLDAVQAASNSAASTVSGPVDLLALALRKLGIPVGDAPMGGSAWMERQGLTRPVQQGASQVVGETLGLLSPAVAAAKAPQVARGLLQMGENAAAPRLLGKERGAVVWHGSPHKFDAFDSSKIGTGEGAQAYGHGLYLAESPEVAQSYQALGYRQGNVGKVGNTPLHDLYNQVQDKAKMSNTYPKDVLTNAKNNGYAADAVAWLEKQVLPKYEPAGSLYKVDLPDTAIARMLDWDKPLSQQAAVVQDALTQFRGKGLVRNGALSEYTGEDIVRELGRAHADRMRSSGIPGIRYLDGGSRGAGMGTSNYVVFPGEETLLKILERNGVPLR